MAPKSLLGVLNKVLNGNNNGRPRRAPRRRVAPKRQKARAPAPRVRMRAATIPASVNTASRIKSSQSRNLHAYSNTDRLVQLTLPAGAAKGTVIYDQVITPSIAARLRTQASLFQKVEYSRLRFEVQTQTPTTNGGGYVVAFLHDPQMDLGSGEAALRALTAVQGTNTSKFWQSVDMSVQTTRQQYFTLNGADVRLFSPGRFVVLSDGPPTEPVSITILFHWTVCFTRPALQRLVATLPQLVVVDSFLRSGQEYLRRSTWNPVTNVSTPPTNDTTSASYRMDDAVSGLPAIGSIGNNILWYLLPSPVYLFQTGGQVVPAPFVSFRATPSTDTEMQWGAKLHTLPSDDNAVQDAAANSGPQVFQGARLTPVVPDEYSGTVNGPFLMTASSSISVNQQPSISKSFSTMPRNPQTTTETQSESLTEQLSRLQLTL